MGRSVPPWRWRVEHEVERWQVYRRGLTVPDQHAFDALLDGVRQRRAAGGLLPAAETSQTMMLSMLVDLMARFDDLNRRLAVLEEGRGDD